MEFGEVRLDNTLNITQLVRDGVRLHTCWVWQHRPWQRSLSYAIFLVNILTKMNEQVHNSLSLPYLSPVIFQPHFQPLFLSNSVIQLFGAYGPLHQSFASQVFTHTPMPDPLPGAFSLFHCCSNQVWVLPVMASVYLFYYTFIICLTLANTFLLFFQLWH